MAADSKPNAGSGKATPPGPAEADAVTAALCRCRPFSGTGKSTSDWNVSRAPRARDTSGIGSYIRLGLLGAALLPSEWYSVQLIKSAST